MVADHLVSKRLTFWLILKNHQLQTHLQESNYFFYTFIHGVRNTVWGDFICIQALSEIFSITVNVLHVRTDSPGI